MDNLYLLFKMNENTTEESLYNTYKKIVKNVSDKEEKKRIKKAYRDCLQNLDSIKQNMKKKKLSPEEFKKFNDHLNENPSLHGQYFMRPVKNESLFGGIRIDPQQEAQVRDVVGKGSSFNRDKFNQIFEKIKGEQEPQLNFNYNNISGLNDFVDSYQDVASYGGIIVHMGEHKTIPGYPPSNESRVVNFQIPDRFDEEYKPREYYNNNREAIQPQYTQIKSKKEFLDHKRSQLLQESQRNKEFIQQNSFIFSGQLNLDDDINERNIDLLSGM